MECQGHILSIRWYTVAPRQLSVTMLPPLMDLIIRRAQQPVWSCRQAWEWHPSTSSSSAPDWHLSWTSSWSHLETSPWSPKKQVAGSYSLWQQPSTCWSMEMCYPRRSFSGDATVPADYAMTTLTTVACLRPQLASLHPPANSDSSLSVCQDRSVATFHAWVGTVRCVERLLLRPKKVYTYWPTRLDLFVLHYSFQSS